MDVILQVQEHLVQNDLCALFNDATKLNLQLVLDE